MAVVAVMNKLGLEKTNFDLALNGSVFKAGKFVIEPLKDLISENAPQARIVFPKFPPVIGAVIMGLWKLNVSIDDQVINKLETGYGK